MPLLPLLLLSTLLLGACQPQSLTTRPATPAVLLPAAAVDLAALPAPEQLGRWRLDGDVVSSDQRLLHYRHSSGWQVQVAVQGFPGGWELMTPQRAVASFYGQQRALMAARLPATWPRPLPWQQEQIEQLPQRPFPLFSGVVAAEPGQLWLLVSAQNGLFVRVYSSDLDRDGLAPLLWALIDSLAGSASTDA